MTARTAETDTATAASFFLDDRAHFEDLLKRLASVGDGIVRYTRREIVAKLREIAATQRLVNERCLFLALGPGGELLLSIRRYYASLKTLEELLDRIDHTSPREESFTSLLAEARAAVADLYESVQVPLAELAASRLDATRLERLHALARSLRNPELYGTAPTVIDDRRAA